MFAQRYTFSIPKFNKRMALTCAASLIPLNGRIAFFIGCAIWSLLGPLGASAQDITVRLLNAKSGKPMSGIRVAMSTWNGTFDIHRPPLPHKKTADTVTNVKGIVVFRLTHPIPEHVGFDVGGLRDFAGCWRLLDLSLEKVIRSGIVADYNESKCGKLKIRVSAKPGEVVILDRKLTKWDRMRQEIP